MAREASLMNTDRSEYGVITADLDLLEKQIAWLAGMPESDEREGLLNLLGGIMDLADPLNAEDLWQELGNVPVNDDGEIQEPFHQFSIGTHREAIWHWLEEEFGVAVHDLMFPASAP